jgi:signal transduction histidine kinase
MSTPFVNVSSAAATTAPSVNGRAIRVLLVEDNETDALLVHAALIGLRDRKLYGSPFDIRIAGHLADARARLAEDHFEVILLDLSLPDSKNHEDTFFHIREHAGGIPVIVLTGVEDEMLGLRMVRDGAQDYLIKSRLESYVIVKAIHYAIERQRSDKAYAELRLKLIAAQEQERHRIARELHDQTSQSIAALMLGLKSVAQTFETTQTGSHLAQLQKLAGELARDVHSLALELRPTSLDDLGLEVTLSNHLDAWSTRSQISADFHSRGFRGRRLPMHLETTMYRIAQEALTNIMRHAQAGRASIVLELAHDRVNLIVEDDGCGFDVTAVMKKAETEQKLGLLGMKERVALVGGSFSMESVQGRGTALYVRIPVSRQQNGEIAQWTN